MKNTARTTRHVMVDIETLDTRPGAVILSIGATAFERSSKGLDPHVFDDYFYVVISRNDCEKHGMTVSQDTLDWWSKQSDEARQVLRVAEDPVALSLEKALGFFRDWLKEQAELNGGEQCPVWGNGSDFDNALLAEAYRRTTLGNGWNYSKNRCHRTLMAMNAYGGHKLSRKREGTHHNAVDDAIHQAQLASLALHNLGAVR